MNSFKFWFTKYKRIYDEEHTFNYNTFDVNAHISDTEIDAIAFHEKKMADLNSELRLEIQNMPNHFKDLIGVNNIKIFLKDTFNRPNKGAYEKLYLKMVKEGQIHCADYREEPCVQYLARSFGIICGALLEGAVLRMLAYRSLSDTNVSHENASFLATSVGVFAAIVYICGITPLLFSEVDVESYQLLKQHRKEIAEYAPQFRERYLQMMISYKETLPEIQTVKDNDELLLGEGSINPLYLQPKFGS